MNLTKEQLEEVQELAGLFMWPREIAILMDLDEDAFWSEIESGKGDIYTAYFKGKVTSKKKYQENIVKMAERGSPQAEEMVKQFINNQEMAEKNARK